MSIQVVPLRPSHRSRWDELARAYKTFYETVLPDADFDRAWRQLLAGERIHGLGAEVDGRLVGLAHYLFHASVWAESVCYLQDLFVEPEARGRGAARALIDAVAVDARARGAARYYWQTRENNATARALYDRVAKFHGFIRYDYPL
jgi:ribosomal protein S18 acetylase RimI-like enzyme